MDQEDCAIPKKIHQIWIGHKEIPEYCAEFGKEMEAMHPDWEYKWSHQPQILEYLKSCSNKKKAIVKANNRAGQRKMRREFCALK